MRQGCALILLGMLLVATSGCSGTGSAPGEQIALGKRLYTEHCGSCHGAKGEGQFPAAPYKPDADGLIGAPPHDSSGHTWHHPDQVLFDITKNGLIVEGFHPMPAFKDKMNDDEIRAVLSFIKTLWKPEHVVIQATQTARQAEKTPAER
jgi:mono/diheme cytochrome c family protein